MKSKGSCVVPLLMNISGISKEACHKQRLKTISFSVCVKSLKIQTTPPKPFNFKKRGGTGRTVYIYSSFQVPNGKVKDMNSPKVYIRASS